MKIFFALFLIAGLQAQVALDWPTFGNDVGRSGFIRSDPRFNKEDVAKGFEFLWKLKPLNGEFVRKSQRDKAQWVVSSTSNDGKTRICDKRFSAGNCVGWTSIKKRCRGVSPRGNFFKTEFSVFSNMKR